MQEGNGSYTLVNNDIAKTLYETPISSATITVNRDTIGTQTKEDDVNLTINAQTKYYNMKGWTNGKFIIELPEQILDIEINDVYGIISNINKKYDYTQDIFENCKIDINNYDLSLNIELEKPYSNFLCLKRQINYFLPESILMKKKFSMTC